MIAEKLAALEPDLPPLPVGEANGADDEGWLVDSRRDYLEQLHQPLQEPIG